MDRGDRKKCFEAGGNMLPPDHQATIFLLEPSKGALGLEPRHDFFDRSSPVLLRLPDALRERRPAPSLPELLPQRFGIIPLSVAMTLRRLRGRPRLPVRTCTASSHGSTCARS